MATKDDYIYIPLKGPTNNKFDDKSHNTTNSKISEIEITEINTKKSPINVNANMTTLPSRPPLPKQPPRVIHASVKTDNEHRLRRRRTIDSSPGASDGSCPPMEPMGLIETDLDTEVTVITSGSNVKTTRSLLNLGSQPRLALVPQKHDTSRRPHKSMEFLLDKENLKTVEVS